jgi:hypothetical protein
VVRLRRHSFQVGEPAYLGEHRVRVLGRYRLVGSELQRVWVSDLDTSGEETIAIDEDELLTPAEYRLAQLQAKVRRQAKEKNHV